MSAALSILTEIKTLVNASGDDKLKKNTNNDLQLLISVFQNPIIKTIASVQVKNYNLLIVMYASSYSLF